MNGGDLMELFKKITDYKSDFITYAQTFENYKWYKPILIAILGTIFYFVIVAVIMTLLNVLGLDSSPDINVQNIISTLTIAPIIPALYIATKIVRDRPFSSYITSNTSWSWSIFFKSFAVAFAVYLIIGGIGILIDGSQMNNTLTIAAFLVMLIVTPFQCFAEELLCRGFLMQTFGSWFKIPAVAIILQGLIFTALHGYDMFGLFSVLISGIAFGFIAWHTKGLEVSSAIHTINNLFALTMEGLGVSVATNIIPIFDVIMSLIILTGTILAIIIIEKKFKWFGFNTD